MYASRTGIAAEGRRAVPKMATLYQGKQMAIYDFDLTGIDDNLKPQHDVQLTITHRNGSTQNVTLLLRIDTLTEGGLPPPLQHPVLCVARIGIPIISR